MTLARMSLAQLSLIHLTKQNCLDSPIFPSFDRDWDVWVKTSPSASLEDWMAYASALKESAKLTKDESERH